MLKKIFIINCFVVTVLANAQIMLPSYQPIQYVNDETICTQNWSTINLDTSAYSDGTPIPQVTDATQWWNLTTGAWCYYRNDTANGAVYGKLYNWYAVAGIYDAASAANPALRKKLAPNGWHIPNDAEWSNLINCLDPNYDEGNRFSDIAGGKMKATGTIDSGTGLWRSPNTGATNTSGFTGLPGGYRSANGGNFTAIGSLGYWWSSSETSTVFARNRSLNYDTDNAGGGSPEKKNGFSVRCLRD